MIQSDAGNDAITKLLLDIRLEALTAVRDIEPEDQLYASLTYISELSTRAISLMEQPS